MASTFTFTCAHCGNPFHATRTDALYCPDSTCRQDAWRGRLSAWRDLGRRLAALEKIEVAKAFKELTIEAKRLNLLDGRP